MNQVDIFGDATAPPQGGIAVKRGDTKASATGRQKRAIKNFCDKGYRPMLSTHPTYYFQAISTGEEVQHHIKDLEAQYDSDRKEAAKARRRQAHPRKTSKEVL